jgi:hypothetical protein
VAPARRDRPDDDDLSAAEVVTAMRTAGRLLVLGWLLAALLVLALDGRLPMFLGWTLPGSALVLVGSAVARHQLAPPKYNRPSLPERYQVADDLRRSLAEVVAIAEAEAARR